MGSSREEVIILCLWLTLFELWFVFKSNTPPTSTKNGEKKNENATIHMTMVHTWILPPLAICIAFEGTNSLLMIHHHDYSI